jgi:hypothetical protein
VTARDWRPKDMAHEEIGAYIGQLRRTIELRDETGQLQGHVIEFTSEQNARLLKGSHIRDAEILRLQDEVTALRNEIDELKLKLAEAHRG